jgi:Flp pilus assembly protein TadD
VTVAIEQGQPEGGKRFAAIFIVGALAGLALGFPAAYALLGRNSALTTAGDDAKSGFLITDAQQALNTSNPDRALALLLEAAALSPKNEVVQNNLCATLNELHHFDAAVVACNAALRLNSDFELARNNLAWAKQSRERVKATAAAPAQP